MAGRRLTPGGRSDLYSYSSLGPVGRSARNNQKLARGYPTMGPAGTSKHNGDLGLDGMAPGAPIQSTNSGATLRSAELCGDDPQRLAVEYRPLVDLIPYARNARTHSDAQVAQIAASIREFGWTNPVLVDGENGIIAGHGRLLAARKLGMSDGAGDRACRALSEAQKRAYIIADNKLALNAGWDDELLGLELGELDALGFDLSLTGFGEDEIAALTSLGNRRPDRSRRHSRGARAAGQPCPAMSGCSGKHRLICGDSTECRRCRAACWAA